jgi:hypothetical protein
MSILVLQQAEYVTAKYESLPNPLYTTYNNNRNSSRNNNNDDDNMKNVTCGEKLKNKYYPEVNMNGPTLVSQICDLPGQFCLLQHPLCFGM